MKLKGIQKFVVIYIVIALIQFGIKEFNPAKFAVLAPAFDGMYVGLVVACIFYYARINIAARLNNRKETAANGSDTI